MNEILRLDQQFRTPTCQFCLADPRHTPIGPAGKPRCPVCGAAYSGPRRDREYQTLLEAGLVTQDDLPAPGTAAPTAPRPEPQEWPFGVDNGEVRVAGSTQRDSGGADAAAARGADVNEEALRQALAPFAAFAAANVRPCNDDGWDWNYETRVADYFTAADFGRALLATAPPESGSAKNAESAPDGGAKDDDSPNHSPAETREEHGGVGEVDASEPSPGAEPSELTRRHGLRALRDAVRTMPSDHAADHLATLDALIDHALSEGRANDDADPPGYKTRLGCGCSVRRERNRWVVFGEAFTCPRNHKQGDEVFDTELERA